MLPISIGVFGSWGTGKSTILNLIENNLEHIENHDDYVIIRFDAWLYQGFDDARASLLEVINTEISKLVKQDEKLYEKALSIGKRINKLRALGWAAEGTALAFGVPTFGLLSKPLILLAMESMAVLGMKMHNTSLKLLIKEKKA